jgi:hypothetical protein
MYIKKGKHKLTLLWEVSYLIVEVIRPGVYRLQEINDTTFPNVWNIKKLRKFYPSLLSFTFSPFFSFFLQARGGRLVMREDVGVDKGSRLFSGPRGVIAEAARQHAFAECSKG